MPTKRDPSFYLPLWEQAMKEEMGIEIKTPPEDQRNLVNALYECKKEAGGFEELILCQPQPAGTIFICKKTVELPL